MAASTEMQLSLARKIPVELHGRCFNCLSLSHKVATCLLPQRCLRCRGYRHLARDCKWPRRAAVMPVTALEAQGGGSRSSSHVPCARAEKVVVGGGTNDPRRRCRQRWSKLPREVDVAVTGNVASSTVTCCPQEPDPLAVALCGGTVPPVWVDPMFDELASSLVVSPSVGASAPVYPACGPFGVSGFVGGHPFATADGSTHLHGCRGIGGG
jgi:hypothetical protein